MMRRLGVLAGGAILFFSLGPACLLGGEEPVMRLIKGKVTGIDPAQRPVIRVMGERVYQATVAADGSWEVRAVAGVYKVTPINPYYRFIPAHRSVILKDADVEGVNFVAQRRVSLPIPPPKPPAEPPPAKEPGRP